MIIPNQEGTNPNPDARLVLEFDPAGDKQKCKIYAKGTNSGGEAAVREYVSKPCNIDNIVKIETFTLTYTNSPNPGQWVYIEIGGALYKVCY